MSVTTVGIGHLACRWDSRPAWSPEQAQAVADFHNRTAGMFDRVRDLSLMGEYAKLQGWTRISDVLLPQRDGEMSGLTSAATVKEGVAA